MPEPATDPLGPLIAPPSVLTPPGNPGLVGNPQSLMPSERPPAAPPAAAQPAATGIGGVDMNAFVNRNMQLEGEGPDPRSSAVSGFMPDTWIGQVRKNVPGATNMSNEQVLALRNDPNLRRQMWASLARDNAASLESAGAPVTSTTLRLANWFGAGGATKLLSSPDETPIGQVFDQNVINANPTLAGKTVGQVKQMVEQQMGAPGSLSIGDLTAQAQRVRESYGAQAGRLDSAAAAAIKQINAQGGSLEESMKRVREAQAKSDEANEGALKAISNAPKQPDIDGIKHLGGLATFVGIFGGLFTRRPMQASLNAAASAIEAYNDHDREKYQVAYKNWQTQTDMLFKIAQMNQTRVRDILYDEQMGLNERKAMLDTTLRAAGLSQLADQARTSGETVVLDWMEKMQSAQLKHDEHMETVRSNAAYRNAVLAMPKNQAMFVTQQIDQMDAEVYAATGQHITPDEKLKLMSKFGRSGGGGGGLSDEAADLIGQQIVAGQTNATVGLARSPADMEKVRNAVAKLTSAEVEKLGLPKEKSGELLAIRAAEFSGLQAGERTAAQQEARIGMANHEAQIMMPIAIETSRKVDRTQFPTLNSLLLAAERGTGDENVVKFATATNSLMQAYARAVTPVGTPTDATRARAAEILNTAYSKGQFEAAIGVMQREMTAALQAPGMVKQDLRHTFTGTTPPAVAGAPAVAAPPTTPVPVPAGHQGDADGTKYKGSDGKVYVKRGEQMVPE